MNAARHLTQEQIAGYTANSLDHEEKRVVGRHLLQCENCRNLMPAPTHEQFWSALMGDSERDKILSVEKHTISEKSPFSIFFSSFRPFRTLAWSGGALIVVAAFSLFIWLGATRQSNSNVEITRKVEVPNRIESNKSENNLSGNEQLPVSVSNTDSKETNPKTENTANMQPPSVRNQSANKKVIRENTKKTKNPEDEELAFLLDNTPPAISSLRPNGEMILRGNNKQNSDSARGFTLIAPVGETVIETKPEFKWEQVANAKSYKITIFDQDFNEVITAQVSG
ncbi:MAG: zf-HC2 domain-containing protein, partial [Aridibacter sp.]